jgi:hypothetical protein
VIYSKWIPDTGGYAYYESSERRGLGDDLPVPRLTDTTAIGVASTDIGRAMPLGAKIVGYGPLAMGSVAPFDRSGLSGVFSTGSTSRNLLYVGIAAASIFAGFLLVKELKVTGPS